ncbi:hypothetical protein [Granulicoccus sp. GXG6511]|uniref:MinD/ParA family ATP-binding protein n=1 Tax=Granulicoccus sp. GXG6511 TaxID=3381351 RepID=UPI003D7E8F39
MSELLEDAAQDASDAAAPAGNEGPNVQRRRQDSTDRRTYAARAAKRAPGSAADDDTAEQQPRRGRWKDSNEGDDMATAQNTDRDDAVTGERPDETRTARRAGGRTEQDRRFARPESDTRPTPRVVSNSGTYVEPEDERPSAGDLIQQLTPETPQKATRGWRAFFGLKPSQREADELRDLATVKTAFRRPVTVMVANPKGGSGKTPVSVLLAAAFGTSRGGGVVAWDNNELRGTMPDRTTSPHRRNVHDMLAKLEQLRWSTSQFTDLAYFLNHQDSGNHYTLGSAQNAGHVVTGQNFRQVHELFSRYFQVIVVDTGNNEAAPNWTAAAAEADCLVVPTKWRKDSLIPAARMLESLQDTNPGLLERTVIAATNGPQDSQQVVKDNGASWFGSNHPIVEIPTDPHIAEGGVINFGQLRPATRRAALRLAAEVSLRLVGAGLVQE